MDLPACGDGGAGTVAARCPAAPPPRVAPAPAWRDLPAEVL
jgi:hypothetical protein